MAKNNINFQNGPAAKKGFTLVELLVAVAIIFIVSTLVLANYREGSRHLVLEIQANIFAQNARKAQEWALAAHQIGGVPQPGYGINVDLSRSASSYLIYTDNNNNGFYDGGDVVRETIFLDKKIEIASSSPSPASVNFIAPDPVTKISGGLNQASVVFRVKGTSITRTVFLNKAGLIYAQ